jgi:anti-anti-sigma factor
MAVSEFPSSTKPSRLRNVVSLRGEHDASTAVALSAELARIVTCDDADLVVDLSEVEFFGASAVGILVRTRALLESRERHLFLQAPNRCAQRVLAICGLDELVAS